MHFFWKLPARAAAAVALALLIAAFPSAGRAVEAAAGQAAARAVVESFHATLLAVMKEAKALGVEGRFARLRPAVARSFNLKQMMAIATGAGWAKASPAEREKLADAFGGFSAANYASRLDSYSGQSFETVSIAPGPRGTVMVTTRLKRPDDSPVRLAYVTRAAGSGWQIIDIVVDDGISELAVRRSEYSSVVSRRGVDGLIAELQSKTKTLLKK